MKKNYSIGLDIGTNSVGWAVIDSETNKIVKKGNKALWGVRLFDEAEVASERRVHRSNRRRFDRRRVRIQLLRELFEEEMKQVDHNFFQKMQESFYQEDDKVNKTIILTETEKKQIREYYEKYPTIYHVRKMLMESDEKQDIRLIYLVLHHMIKYRGNFLKAGEVFHIENLNIKEKWSEIFSTIEMVYPELELDEEVVNNISYQNLEQAVLQESNTDKKKYLEQELKPFGIKKEFISELGKAVSGNKFSIPKLLQIEDEEFKISFKGSDYEDLYDKIESFAQDKIEVIELLKQLYNMIFLKTLFKGEINSLSMMMVEKYQQHKADLKFLKQILSYNRKEYNIIFRSNDKLKKPYICIYEQYVHNTIDYDDFKKAIKKALENTMEYINDQNLKDQYTADYKFRIENETFLPRITDKSNSNFPYQLNLEEMRTIIAKQGKYYPFLLEKGENGKNKIETLLEFRIPYYVGPLNNTTSSSEVKNSNAWVIRGKEKITPYNFEQVVDLEASAEQFITKMISHCTYLLSEPVMPANSILYSEYKVWNELKHIKVEEQKMSVEIQEKVYRELFLKTDQCPTSTMLEKFLRTLSEYSMYSTLHITGFSVPNKFMNSMKSYVDFFGENGIFKGTNYTISDAENLIRWITLFEDKKILEKKIKKEYPNFTEEMIHKILSKKYKGWGNLSEKLLTTKYYQDLETTEKKSILDLLKTTKDNFMQILFEKKYQFDQMINDYNEVNTKEKMGYHVVENLVTSPANKRGIYQSLLVLEEVIHFMGYEPKQIAIEMAREDGVKKRKDSKKEYLTQLYKNCSASIDNYKQLKAQLDSCDNKDFDNQKLFLYFIQEGKSLYSRKPFNIEDLDQYEIDHIIPRTLVKNDSIENKALVFRDENKEKAASVVLPFKYRNSVNITWWKHLQKLGLLSAKKVYNLMRSTYSESDIEGFINRQMVETRQIIKHVANIIKHYHEKTEIVYLKAALSHAYRQKFELFKFRDINDYHHAHDAYLAVILGNFKQNYLKYIDFNALKELSQTLIRNHSYQELNYGYVINSMDNRFLLCNADTGEVLDLNQLHHTIEKTLYRNDILVSRKTEIKSGEFYNETKNKKGQNGVNLKDYLPSTRYGSYTSLKPAYGMVVKYKNKNKENQKMIGLPIYIEEKSKKNSNLKREYICSLLNIDDPSTLEIVIEKIPFDSLLDWNDQICQLRGATDKVEVCNALEFHIDKSHMKMWKYTFNRLLNQKGKVDEVTYSRQLEEIIEYIVGKIEKKYVLYQNLLEEMKEGFHLDSINELKLEEKEKIIKEMFHLLKCNSQTANLSFLKAEGKNMSTAFGRKRGQTIEHAKIYYQSVTGLKEYYREF